MNKNNTITTRKEAIKNLIARFPVDNQETLVSLLKKEYGIETNQSIVSRDLRELEITKHLVKDTMIYKLNDIDVHKEILRLGVTNVSHNEVMIIINTLPAMASFAAEYLDQHPNTGILATLAGENVVFVVPTATKDIVSTFEAICELIHVKKPNN